MISAALIMAIYVHEMFDILRLYSLVAYSVKMPTYWNSCCTVRKFFMDPMGNDAVHDLSRQFRHSSLLRIFYVKLIDIYVAVMPF